MTDFGFPTTPLKPVREDWNTALCIAAHPDDLEYGAASAVARWTSAGKRVVYSLMTSGEAGIDGIAPEQAGPLREGEERAAADVVGVSDVEFLGFADGVLENTLSMRKAIVASIRRHRPDVVVTGNFGRSWGGGYLNTADHIATGLATVEAIQSAGNRWIFRDLLDEGLQPWNGVRALLVIGSMESTHAIDISDHLDAGVRSLLEHKAYLDGLGDPDFDAKQMLEAFGDAAGKRLGTRFAVPVEIYRFGDF